MTEKYLEFLYSKPLELEQMIQESPIAYVPFGALEWHGEHNVLGVDSIKITEICKRVAAMTGGVLFPCVNYGSFNTMKFPYTLHNPARPLKKLTRRIIKQIYEMGFRIIILLTGHYPGGQQKQIRKAARKISKKFDDCFAIGIPEQAVVSDLGYYGDHAAEWETSLMMAIDDKFVDLEKIELNLNFPERAARHGILGRDPFLNASKEKGENILKKIVERLSNTILEVEENKSIEPFERIYTTHKIIMRKAFSSLKNTFTIQGIEGKREGIAFLKWWLINAKRYKPDYKLKLKKKEI